MKKTATSAYFYRRSHLSHPKKKVLDSHTRTVITVTSSLLFSTVDPESNYAHQRISSHLP